MPFVINECWQLLSARLQFRLSWLQRVHMVVSHTIPTASHGRRSCWQPGQSIQNDVLNITSQISTLCLPSTTIGWYIYSHHPHQICHAQVIIVCLQSAWWFEVQKSAIQYRMCQELKCPLVHPLVHNRTNSASTIELPLLPGFPCNGGSAIFCPPPGNLSLAFNPTTNLSVTVCHPGSRPTALIPVSTLTPSVAVGALSYPQAPLCTEPNGQWYPVSWVVLYRKRASKWMEPLICLSLGIVSNPVTGSLYTASFNTSREREDPHDPDCWASAAAGAAATAAQGSHYASCVTGLSVTDCGCSQRLTVLCTLSTNHRAYM